MTGGKAPDECELVLHMNGHNNVLVMGKSAPPRTPSYGAHSQAGFIMKPADECFIKGDRRLGRARAVQEAHP